MWATHGDQALYADDENEDDAMDNTSMNRARIPKETPLLDEGKADNVTVVEVTVRIWVTKEFAAMEDDVQGYIDTCFEEANACLANSQIPMRLRHLGTILWAEDEVHREGYETMKKWIGDARLNSTTKNALLNTADAAFMLTSNNMGNLGGQGYMPGKTDKVKLPFAWARHSMARYGKQIIPIFPTLLTFSRGYYVFLHELGHVFGGQHEGHGSNGVNKVFEYGYGSLFKKREGTMPGYHTIMA